MANAIPDLVSRPHARRFSEIVRRARRCLTLVTPYITQGGLDVATAALNGCPWPELRVLTSLTAEAIWQGSCEPAALAGLMERCPRASVRSLPGLHAKVYVADDEAALVTSANLTVSGLNANYEYGVLLTERRVVRGILRDLDAYSRVGTPLGKEELAALSSLAVKASGQRQAAEAQGLVDLREEVAGIVLPAHVGGRSETGVLGEAVLYVLHSQGALPTHLIEEAVQALHPELCDDSRERIIGGKRFGKRWKHILRSAQQRLKRRGLIRREGHVWRLTRGAGP